MHRRAWNPGWRPVAALIALQERNRGVDRAGGGTPVLPGTPRSRAPGEGWRRDARASLADSSPGVLAHRPDPARVTMRAPFFSRDHFAPDRAFQLLPFRFARLDEQRYVVT